MRRILVLRGGALGDFIVTLPALALLRQRWPAAEIELVGNATAAALARARGLLTAVHSQHERRWSVLYGHAPLPPAMAAWLADFDLVLNYWPDPAGDLRRRFPLCPEQSYLFAPAMPERAPAAAHYCAPLAAFGLETRDYIVPLADYRGRSNRDLKRCRAGPRSTPRKTFQSSYPVFGAHSLDRLGTLSSSNGQGAALHATKPRRESEQSGSIMAHDTAGAILVHPGSGSPRKNWPIEKWLALLHDLEVPVTLVLGEAEAAPWRAINLPPIPRLENLPLEDLVARFSTCRLFLGHDSGLSHLAAACGAPCLLLFGPTDPAIWAPPAAHVRLIRRDADLNSISVEEVRRELTGMLARRA